jgi:hypothetical protein
VREKKMHLVFSPTKSVKDLEIEAKEAAEELLPQKP